MSAKKANEPRVLIRVPVSFRDKLNRVTAMKKIAATDYLETVTFKDDTIVGEVV